MTEIGCPCLWCHVKGLMGFPDGSVVKNPAAMQETWVQSLCQEDAPEEEIATHSSIIAWEILWTEESDGLQSMVLQRVGHDLATERAQKDRTGNMVCQQSSVKRVFSRSHISTRDCFSGSCCLGDDSGTRQWDHMGRHRVTPAWMLISQIGMHISCNSL